MNRFRGSRPLAMSGPRLVQHFRLVSVVKDLPWTRVGSRTNRSSESRRRFWIGPGDNRARTGNLRRAKAALSQLSYVPARSRHRSKAGPEISGLRGGSAETARLAVGLARIELATSRLSGVRSNHLSYRPGVA